MPCCGWWFYVFRIQKITKTCCLYLAGDHCKSAKKCSMMTASNGNIFCITGLWGIHQWPVNFPHKGQWRGALMFSLICSWTNGQLRSRWFEMPPHPLWYHCNAPEQQHHHCWTIHYITLIIFIFSGRLPYHSYGGLHFCDKQNEQSNMWTKPFT